ncbi:Alpha/Beta hydrolase fold [Lasallia pustulata]|uniref:Alpha/Beta hydrolase fold n=1 Tax=Lasallia pustulata TaxID=136370 RepID=A0A1W5CT85_9LECA|nr:Alpha/Beta hydrolase fold [Lasallia pustulata]
MQTKGKKIQFDTQYRGLHNLHTPSGAVSVNVIAVHGLAAHPLYTWVRKGVDKSWNWLEHQLVEFIPGARVWTFGYESNWLGDEAISTSHEDVAVALLDGLHDKSHHLFDQPLIFIAHSFGGIVLMKAFIRAENSRNWKNLFEHTEAILFFGTPFQGMNKWFTDDMPALAKLKYTQVQGLILDLMKEHNEALGELRQTFSGMVNTYQGPGIGCFYETKASNIQRIVEKLDLDKVADDKTDRIQLVIKDSAILERGPRRCLRNRETNVHEIRIYQINRSDWDLLRLIALDGTSLKMLSFSPDGALLACTVYGYDQQSNNGQYYERVMVHNVKDASPRDVCRISMNFIEGQGGITSATFWRSVRRNCQWSCIAPVLINARHHPHRARHELNQFRLRTRARICTAAVAPRGNFIALLDTAGKLCFIPLQAGGLFGAKSADSKDCGISSNTSQPPIELPGFHLEQNLDSQQVSLRFDEVDGKLFAVDHRKQIRVVDFQKRVEPATSLNRKVSSFLSNQFHGKKHAG